MKDLNPSILSAIPRTVLTEAVNNPKSSKRKLCVTILKSLTGQDEVTIISYLNDLEVDMDSSRFNLKIEQEVTFEN